MANKTSKSIVNFQEFEDFVNELKKEEGFIPVATRLKDHKGGLEPYYTIGYGDYGPHVKKGDTTDKPTAEKKLRYTLKNTYIPTTKRLFPDFDTFSPELRVGLVQTVFRGGIEKGHETTKLINKKNFRQAATEFLDHDEYRAAKAGLNPGVALRMEKVADLLMKEQEARYKENLPRERPADLPEDKAVDATMPRERPADLQPKIGEKTGEKTVAGRDIYKTPEGESVSEKSATIKFGENAYVNAPSIHNGVQYSEDEVRQMLLDGKIKPTSRHDNLEEALKTAKSRSASLMNESEEDRQSFIDRIKQLLETLSPSEPKTVYNKGGLSMEKQMSLFNEGGEVSPKKELESMFPNILRMLGVGTTEDIERIMYENAYKRGEKISQEDIDRFRLEKNSNKKKRKMSKFNEGGLEQDGGMTDPVSGNDVPVGSTQAEVRDDIPAMLSEGEFVFPADVVRYIGLEKLMKIRQQAKEGLKKMDDMGQMGNSEEAIVPDDIPMESIPDIPFDIDDLDLMEEPQEFAPGGMPRRRYSFSELVGPPSQATAPKMRYFVNANGNILVIPEVNGKLMQEVPTGYSEKTQEQVLNPESNVSPQDKATVQKIEENMAGGDSFMSNADIAEMEADGRAAAATGTVSGLENTSMVDGKLDYDFNPMRDTPLALSAMPGFTGSVLGAFGSYANQFSAQSAIHEAAFGVAPSIGDILSGKTQAALEALSPTAFNAAKNKALQTYNKVISEGGVADPASGGYGVYGGSFGYMDPETGEVSISGPAGSFAAHVATNPVQAQKDLDKVDVVSKALGLTKPFQEIIDKYIDENYGGYAPKADQPDEGIGYGTGALGMTQQEAAEEEAGMIGTHGPDGPDADPEQGNEPGNVDTEGGVAQGLNKGGIATKKKKVKYMKKGGLASRK